MKDNTSAFSGDQAVTRAPIGKHHAPFFHGLPDHPGGEGGEREVDQKGDLDTGTPEQETGPWGKAEAELPLCRCLALLPVTFKTGVDGGIRPEIHRLRHRPLENFLTALQPKLGPSWR